MSTRRRKPALSTVQAPAPPAADRLTGHLLSVSSERSTAARCYRPRGRARAAADRIRNTARHRHGYPTSIASPTRPSAPCRHWLEAAPDARMAEKAAGMVENEEENALLRAASMTALTMPFLSP